MKVKAIALALVFSAFLSGAADPEQAPSSDWFPFFLSEKMDPDSPANIGRLVLDAPAGKHGFVKVQGKQFIFEDGTPARFWGTNLCMSACFPSKSQAEIIADRLAFFGFNAVRLHHMDFFSEPKGIFEESSQKRTTQLSPAQLDKLDYLIYQLKLRGIYIDLNLLVSRHFTEADGVEEAERLGMAAKPVSLFDRKLIRLQKKYAHDLLTHTNPYTGLPYRRDPALALIEITNENSLLAHWQWNRLNHGLKKDTIPGRYSAALDEAWKHWLKNKYQTSENIGKAWGEKEVKNFNLGRPLYKTSDPYPAQATRDMLEFYSDMQKNYFKQMLSFLKRGLGIKIPMAGIGGYSVAEDIETMESCDFIDFHGYWDHPVFPHKPWDPKDFTMRNQSMVEDKELGLIGAFNQYQPISPKPYTITEWNHCYPNPYAYETPLLVASEAAKKNWAGLFQFAFKHDAPKPSSLSDLDSFFDIFDNPQQLILDSAAGFLFHNARDVVTTLDNRVFLVKATSIESAVGFIKDKEIDLADLKVKSATNGTLVLLSPENKPLLESNRLLLSAVSEARNKNSGWNVSKKFDWGKAPAELKKMSLEILWTDKSKKIKLYELNPRGVRSKELLGKPTSQGVLFSTQESLTPWFEVVRE